MAVTAEQTLAQSKNAYNQWCVQWRDQAKQNSKYVKKSLNDFLNVGVGKAILSVANGYSFEANIEAIKEHQDKVDILCCDKTLGHLLDNGITPTYCMVCDANVDYETYMEKWKDKLQNTIMFANVCANPKWVENGNWKDRYFFVNKDVINSEKEFSKLSGCTDFIPAGTNVSNAMVVLLTNSDERGRRNFFGYDKILLIGYDYCWLPDKNYYAFDNCTKRHYMRHVYCRTIDGRLAYTSNNLLFSARWFEQYVQTFDLPVVQCAVESVLGLKYKGKLEDQMQYNFKPEDGATIRDLVKKKTELKREMNLIKEKLQTFGKDHYLAFVQSI